MNFILIILDSLRKDHVGAYGNDWIKTPNLDAFAKKSAVFTRAYPEVLPTLPFRNSLYTGRRVYPFKRWSPARASYPYIERYGCTKDLNLPGWAPISAEDTTMAELFNDHGYRTAMFTDCFHQFYPGMNYHRGFQSWNFIRGQEWDMWHTDILTGENRDMSRFFSDKANMENAKVWEIERNWYNVAHRRYEEDYFAPQVFRSATNWLEENHRAENIFMCIDSFDPHEPWDTPNYYRELYYPNYSGKETWMPIYTDQASDYLSDDELKYMRACYASEVTMVDNWFGFFMNKVKLLGLDKNSIIAVISDHGHQLGENNFTGKVAKGLYPCLIDLVFMVQHPENIGAGKQLDAFVQNHDILPTVSNLLGWDMPEWCEGEDLMPLIEGKKDKVRDYVTAIMKEYLWARDDDYALIMKTDKSYTALFDVASDPDCTNNVADQHPDQVEKLYALLLKDADGEIPVINVSFPVTDGKM